MRMFRFKNIILTFILFIILTGKKISDAIRTEALSLDVNGRAFWKLKGYARDQEILLQGLLVPFFRSSNLLHRKFD